MMVPYMHLCPFDSLIVTTISRVVSSRSGLHLTTMRVDISVIILSHWHPPKDVNSYYTWYCIELFPWAAFLWRMKLSFQAKLFEHSLHTYLGLDWECICM